MRRNSFKRDPFTRRLRCEQLEDRRMLSIVVDSLDDNVDVDGLITLREAVEAANMNMPVGDAPAGQMGLDRIVFDPSLYSGGAAEIVLAGTQLEISDDLEILGPGAEQLAVNANGQSRVFYVAGNVSAMIDGITITGGSADLGGGVLSYGALSVVNTMVTANLADWGGGIYQDGFDFASTMSVCNSTFTENYSYYGGGIANYGGEATVSGTLFYDNYADFGGAIINDGFSDPATMEISDSTFSYNFAAENGGGILNNCGTMAISNTDISNNSAAYGGGVYNDGRDGSADMTIIDSTISENYAEENGGGLNNDHSAVSISNSTFSYNLATCGGGVANYSGEATIANSFCMLNSADYGGGILNNYGTMSVSDAEISYNSATYGSGILNEGTLRVTDTLFEENFAAEAGGGIYCYNGSATITESTFKSNKIIDHGDGGGIYNCNGLVTISNSGIFCSEADYGSGIYNEGILIATDTEFIENSADEAGGGIYCYNGSATITESTFSENEATNHGGGIYNCSSTLTVSNSTFSENSAYQGAGILNDGLYGPAEMDISCSTFTNNSADDSGGGIRNNYGTLSVSSTDFSNNWAVYGGGITNCSGTATISDSTFSANTADLGGGIFNDGYNGPATMEISGSTFWHNSGSHGGAIHNFNAVMTVFDSTLDTNWAENGGGILNNGQENTASLTVSASTFVNNSAYENGGGLLNHCGMSTISNSTFSGNSSDLGGGIYNDGSIAIAEINISDSTFSQNSATTNGGGIFNNFGVMTVFGSTFDTNWADYGGGILNFGREGTASLTVSASIFTNNSVTENGGGLLNYCGTMAVSYSTFSDNLAKYGGGIFNNGFHEQATLEVHRSTFSANTATDGGGGINNLYGVATVTESAFDGNFANNSGGGIMNCGGTMTVSDSTISCNQAYFGGGVFNDGTDVNASLTILNSTLLENTANGDGGGIKNQHGTVTATDAIFTNNSARHGGGILNYGISDTVSLVILDSKFTGNSATINGGGIANYGGIAELSNSKFLQNTAICGGAIVNDGSSTPATLTALGSTFSENSATDNGGAIINYNGSMAVQDASFSSNSASFGGGIFNYSAGGQTTLTVSDSTFFNNTITNDGGGIANYGGDVYVANTTFLNNAANIGAGIHSALGTLAVERAIFACNTATYGGGIFSDGKTGTATLDVSNSIFSNNVAIVGGAILNDGFNGVAEVTVTNSTITGNLAADKGGGILTNCIAADTVLNNTIVANNESTNGPDIVHEDGGIFSGAHNLIGDGSGQTYFVNGANGNIVGTAESPIDPRFVRDPASGGDYGDLWLRPDSPAVDAGNNMLAVDYSGTPLSTDLAGNPRVRGGTVDMGAYEYAPRVDFTAVIVTAPSGCDAQGQRDTRPDGAGWIDEWQTFYVELWLDTPATDNVAVMSASVDLTYNTAYHTATEIQYGPAFTENQSGTIDDAAGMVGGIGAETLHGDIGDDRYALLARVRFEPTANDDGVPFYIDEAYVESVDNGIVLESPQAALAGGLPCETLLGDAPDTRLCAVPFDLYNDGIVDMKDFVFFAREFKKQPGVNTDSPYAFASDYNRSGVVDMEDFIYFAANYKRSRPCDAITYPGSVHSGLGGMAQTNMPATQTTTTTGTSTETQTTAITGTSTTTTSLVYENRNINDAGWVLVFVDDEEDARDAVFASIGVEDEAMGLLDE